MGFGYRKTFKAGPFRITASKSGISYSTGVRGARVTKRADGRVQTTLSAPHTGLRYTSTSGGKRRSTSRRGAAGPQAAPGRESLPGQRSSVLPQPPPVGTRPLPFKGHLATATLHPDRIQIDRTLLGRMNGNGSATIPWPQLVGVDFVEPTPLINGHVHFAMAADPRGLTATGRGRRMAAVARNPHAIMFTWQQRAAFGQLRNLLMANAVHAPAQAPSAASRSHGGARPERSVADELAKLHALHRQGALTAAEFELAKIRLLGR